MSVLTEGQLLGSLSVEQEAGGAVLWLRGEIDVAVVERFDDQDRPPQGQASPGHHDGQVQGSTSGPVVVAMDAGDVTIIDSSGLAFMARCLRASQAAGRPAVLRRSSPRVDELMRLTGLDSLFARPA